MSSEPTIAERDNEAHAQLSRALEELEKTNYASALEELEKIPLFARPPAALSAYALCLAEVKGNYKSATNICHEAIKKDPKNAEHYYRQGRILLLAGRKKDAVWVLRMGLRHGNHRGIIDCLGWLGVRRPPPLQFLDRGNPVNKYLGLLLTRLKLR
ncbi:MAG TPA: tetratricopeptide repeat protein [Geobacteraceae bacterium]|nr:tetratricopeptide repeat protein [Geobacteraceae bacterium]